jgi:NAD(P)H-hydrate epimerase
MKVVTAEEMRKIDEKAIKELGIPGLTLMGNAGKRVVEVIKREFKDLKKKKVDVFVGKGNNGGDGLVVARLLNREKVKVKVFVTGKKRELKGDARTNLERALKKKIEVVELSNLRGLKSELKESGLIIDALLGTGTKGEVKGFLASLIKILNGTNKPIISIDIPSGLDADRGRILGACIKATHTVTMGLPKRGLILFPGAKYAGRLSIVDIGIPKQLLEDENISLNLITEKDIVSSLPLREPDAHKGSFGHIFVIAGSLGLTGAAALTSLGALRSGVGLVTLGIPQSLNEIMERKLTEVMTKPLAETKEKTLGLTAYEEIKKFSSKVDVLALGPGLSINPETSELVRKIVSGINLPMVIDADGVNALAGHLRILKTIRPSDHPTKIITPHPGEMARLLNISASQVQEDRIGIAQKVAQEYKVIVVLKGARTVIASSRGDTYLNPSGNPGMASGGSGDVLTGLIASLIGQKMEPLEASKAGVYIHGLAGDMAAQEKGEMSLIASDLLERIPQVLKRLCALRK